MKQTLKQKNYIIIIYNNVSHNVGIKDYSRTV